MRPAVFLHVPRTAGTAIRQALGLYDPEQHLPAGERIRRGQLEGRFVFTFVRNPWDRLVSLFAFLHPRDQADPEIFRRWARNGMPAPRGLRPILYAGRPWAIEVTAPQARFLDGTQLDFMGRHEQLERDFAELCLALGVKAELDQVNAAPRDLPPAAYYDRETLDLVARIYHEDVELAGATEPTP